MLFLEVDNEGNRNTRLSRPRLERASVRAPGLRMALEWLEIGRVLCAISAISLISPSLVETARYSIALTTVEAAFALFKVLSRADGSREAPAAGAISAHMTFYTLRFGDPALERAFRERRFRDTAKMVPSFCLLQIVLSLSLAAFLPAVLPALPYVVLPLLATAVLHWSVRRLSDPTTAQARFYWLASLAVLLSSLLAAERQTRGAPLVYGLSSHGIFATCFLWAYFAAYLRLFVVDLWPRLAMIACVCGSSVYVAVMGAPLSVLTTPAYMEPLLLISSILIGDGLGLKVEHGHRSAFRAKTLSDSPSSCSNTPPSGVTSPSSSLPFSSDLGPHQGSCNDLSGSATPHRLRRGEMAESAGGRLETMKSSSRPSSHSGLVQRPSLGQSTPCVSAAFGYEGGGARGSGGVSHPAMAMINANATEAGNTSSDAMKATDEKILSATSCPLTSSNSPSFIQERRFQSVDEVWLERARRSIAAGDSPSAPSAYHSEYVRQQQGGATILSDGIPHTFGTGTSPTPRRVRSHGPSPRSSKDKLLQHGATAEGRAAEAGGGHQPATETFLPASPSASGGSSGSPFGRRLVGGRDAYAMYALDGDGSERVRSNSLPGQSPLSRSDGGGGGEGGGSKNWWEEELRPPKPHALRRRGEGKAKYSPPGSLHGGAPVAEQAEGRNA